jgi:transcriptional regulator with XRE-family HTH domain
MKFGSTIKKLRKAKKLTLSDVSRESGIQMATLSRIENNKMTGSVNNHFGLAKALGLKLSELFKEFEKDNIPELGPSQFQ